MKKLLLILLIFTIAYHNAKAQCKINYANYHLVIDENFDSYGGSVANLFGPNSYWKGTPDDIYHGWGGDYGEYYDPSQSSLIPDGNGGHFLRLTATKLAAPITLPNLRKPRYKSGMLTLKNRNHPMITGGPFDPTSSSCGVSTDRGFKYGMFEIRCKLSEADLNVVDAWSAFWLISVDAEIDIIDNAFRNNGIEHVSYAHDWTKLPWSPHNDGWEPTTYCASCPIYDSQKDYPAGAIVRNSWDSTSSYIAIKNVGRTGCGNRVLSNYRNLVNEYTTYTCVWTEEKITFFVEGREIFTLPSSLIKLKDFCPLNIIASLQVTAEAQIPSFSMDIDYIRVYKPNSPAVANDFKTSNEFVFNNLFAVDNRTTNTPQKVSASPNAIAPNTNDATEIFYRGVNNYLQRGKLNTATNKWDFKQIPFNDGSDIKISGDLKFSKAGDCIIYAGSDNRLNLFGRSNTLPSGFYHWYVSSNPNCYWCVTDDKVSINPGSIAIAENGSIFFKGLDDQKVHLYQSGTNWIHSILPHPNSQSFISTYTNIAIDPLNNSNSIFYRGVDGRLQTFYKASSSTYAHAWIDDVWTDNSRLVKHQTENIVWAPALNAVLYIGNDNKLHMFRFANNAWQHSVIPYNYGSPALGYVNGDFLLNGLSWDESKKRLYYTGFDGRLQAFQYVTVSFFSYWTHTWIDENWNNGDFSSFNSFNSIMQRSSISLDNRNPEKGIYTKNKIQDLYIVQYKECETRLNSCLDYERPEEYRKNIFKDSTSLHLTQTSSLYPNPATKKVSFQCCSKNCSNMDIEIYNIDGRSVIKRSNFNSGSEIDISGLHNGIYLLKSSCRNEKKIQKLIKI